MLIQRSCHIVNQAGCNVWLHLHKKYIFELTFCVKRVRLVKIKLQYISILFDKFILMPLELVPSIVPIRYGSLLCIDLVLQEKFTVSCGNGDLIDQVQPQLVPEVWTVVTGVVNVIPEFHQQFPDKPVMADKSQLAAQAQIISSISRYVRESAAAVIVLAVQGVLEPKYARSLLAPPLIVSVPVTVILPHKVKYRPK